MLIPRIIPILLLQGQGLVKGVRFREHQYIGDPLNAVKIFNDKEVDELIFLDINATGENRTIDVEQVERLADECYMPFAVGGGVGSIEQIRKLINAGAEKVCLNTAAVGNPQLIRQAAEVFGRQSIVVSIDVRKNWRSTPHVCTHNGARQTTLPALDWAQQVSELGAGEILLTAIDEDGSMTGYDLDLVRTVSRAVSIPVIAAGGGGNLHHLSKVIHQAGASAAAAGSLFVFHGLRRAVLINFPTPQERAGVVSHPEPASICR